MYLVSKLLEQYISNYNCVQGEHTPERGRFPAIRKHTRIPQFRQSLVNYLASIDTEQSQQLRAQRITANSKYIKNETDKMPVYFKIYCRVGSVLKTETKWFFGKN